MERYGAYKDSGVEWIGEIPAEWDTVPLKSLFAFGKGLPITKADLVDEGVPVISYGQIHSKANTPAHIDDSLIRFVPESFLESNPMSLTVQGDFLFADTSEDVDGSGSFVYHDRVEKVFAGYHTLILSPRNRAHGRYLSYLFQSDEWKGQIRSRVSGVKLFSLTQRILGDVCALLPPHSVQVAIADYLDAKTAEIDALVEDCEREVELLQEYRKAVISEAVTKGLDPDAPMKDSDVEWIGKVPENWEVRRIKTAVRRKSESGHPDETVLSLYRDYGVVVKDSRDDNFNRTSEKTEAYRFVEINDLVVNKMKAWQGSLAVSKYQGIVSPAYYVYSITDPSVHPRYMHYQLRDKSYLPEYRRLSGGIRPGQWDLSSENFVSIPMLVPPQVEQQMIAAYLDAKTAEIDSLIEAKQQMADKLREYRKSLISEAVTGKFKVPGVKK